MLEGLKKKLSKKVPGNEIEKSVRKYAEDDEEYIKYAKDVERTLRYLESNLHDTDDPEEIAMGALKTACEFYDADWCGVFDVDLDIGVWTPIWWYNVRGADKTKELFEEYETTDCLSRWIQAMKAGKTIYISDVEKIKPDNPDEYKLYKRLGVGSVMGVPFWKRPTGYLVVRNPKRYTSRSSLLKMLAYVIIAQVNERKFLEDAKLSFSPESIQKDTDVMINMFGNIEIYTPKGVLREDQIKSPQICRILAYMLLNRKVSIPAREITDAIWPEEQIDDPGKKVKGHIHRFRNLYPMNVDYTLISTTAKGYRLNPKLNIMTDLKQFESYWLAAQKTTSTAGKIDLLKKAMELYKGEVFSAASTEHWLIHTATHYQLMYVAIVNELLATFDEIENYYDMQQYATEALNMEPGNMQAYYWLIYAMYQMGEIEMAKNEMKIAEQNLSDEEYHELQKYLKDLKNFDEDYTRKMSFGKKNNSI